MRDPLRAPSSLAAEKYHARRIIDPPLTRSLALGRARGPAADQGLCRGSQDNGRGGALSGQRRAMAGERKRAKKAEKRATT